MCRKDRQNKQATAEGGREGKDEEEGAAKEEDEEEEAAAAPPSEASSSTPLGRFVEPMSRALLGILSRPSDISSTEVSPVKVGHDPTGLAVCLSDQAAAAAVIRRVEVPAAASPPPPRDLPQELIDRIRAYLPYSAYVRSAAVSKLWSHTTFSPRMLALYWELHPPEPWLFALSEGNEDEAFLLDPIFCRWRKITLPFMAQDRVELVSSSNGLLCCNTHKEDLSLLMVNPLKGTTRMLPQCDVVRPDPIVGLMVDTNTCTFKVIAVNSFELGAWTHVYDSVSDKWIKTCRLHPYRRLAVICSLFHRGCFYCWSLGPPQALMIYDLEKQVWREMPIPLPSTYSFGKLVEYQGRILLVGLSQGSAVFESISIWEFNESHKDMQEITRMPYRVFKDFSNGKPRPKYFVESCGHFIYFYSEGNPQLVVCDATSKPAHWMQMTPMDPFSLDKGQINLFSLRLHARLVYSL